MAVKFRGKKHQNQKENSKGKMAVNFTKEKKSKKIVLIKI